MLWALNDGQFFSTWKHMHTKTELMCGLGYSSFCYTISSLAVGVVGDRQSSKRPLIMF